MGNRLNGFSGIGKASMVAGMDEIRKNAKVARAVRTRAMAKVLGIPDLDLGEEDVLAGGDITVSRPPSNPWPWVALITAMLLGWAVWSQRSAPETPAQSSSDSLKPGTVTIGIRTE